MNAWLSQALLCACIWPNMQETWLSLCPPSLHYMDQVLRRTLSTDVHGSSLYPHCPPQIWTPAWSWGPEARIPGSGQDAPALPLPPSPNPPNSTCSLQRLLSSSGSPPLTPSLPWSPSPPNAHSIENLYPKTSFVGPAFIEKVSYAGMGTIRETRTGAQSHQAQHPSYGLNEWMKEDGSQVRCRPCPQGAHGLVRTRSCTHPHPTYTRMCYPGGGICGGSSWVDLNRALKNGQVWTGRGGWEEDKVHPKKGGQYEPSDGSRDTPGCISTPVGRNRVIEVDCG